MEGIDRCSEMKGQKLPNAENANVTCLSEAEIYNHVYFSENFKVYGCNMEEKVDSELPISFTVEVCHREMLELLTRYSYTSTRIKTRLEMVVVKVGLTRFCVNIVTVGPLVAQLIPSKVNLLLSKKQMYKEKQMLLRIEGGSDRVTITPHGYLTKIPGTAIELLIKRVGKSPQVRVQHFTPLAAYKRPAQAGSNVGTHKSDIPEKITRQLTLTRSSITYLIGKSGERIQKFRRASNCYIKVLDYNDEANLFQSRRNASQDILIRGYKPDVDQLVKWISSDLQTKE